MAYINPKNDYKDGDILYGIDLNASNDVIKAGVDDNFDRIQGLAESKQDVLTAGEGIQIENNVISNTQTSAEWGNITGTLEDQTDLNNALENKVDKVTGKQLSTEDYTSAEKSKLASLNNYDDTEVRSLIDDKQDTLVSGTNIKTINNQSILGEGNLNIGGGSGGTSDYDELENKPQINNVTLTGNKSLSDLGINIPARPETITIINNSVYAQTLSNGLYLISKTGEINFLMDATDTSSIIAVASKGDIVSIYKNSDSSLACWATIYYKDPEQLDGHSEKHEYLDTAYEYADTCLSSGVLYLKSDSTGSFTIKDSLALESEMNHGTYDIQTNKASMGLRYSNNYASKTASIGIAPMTYTQDFYNFSTQAFIKTITIPKGTSVIGTTNDIVEHRLDYMLFILPDLTVLKAKANVSKLYLIEETSLAKMSDVTTALSNYYTKTETNDKIMKDLPTATNIDSIIDTGTYSIFHATGTLPTGYAQADNTFILDVKVSSNGKIQILHDCESNESFRRYATGTSQLIWSSWESLTSTDLIMVGTDTPTEDTKLVIEEADLDFQSIDYDMIFPIGKVELFFDNLDHSNYLGLHWEQVGAGRVPVGLDINDTDFNAIGKTGGEKTHTLSVNEMPTHNHEFEIPKMLYADVGYGTALGSETLVQMTTHITHDVGGGQAHNILQPYIVMAFWRRIS